jgi:Flp pilus assembly pilin Flp
MYRGEKRGEQAVGHLLLKIRRRGERGQALVEYSLLIALVALTALIGVVSVSGAVDSLYEVVDTANDTFVEVLGGS